jgi:hypothetical protein
VIGNKRGNSVEADTACGTVVLTAQLKVKGISAATGNLMGNLIGKMADDEGKILILATGNSLETGIGNKSGNRVEANTASGADLKVKDLLARYPLLTIE